MKLEKENVRIIFGNILNDVKMYADSEKDAEKQLAYIAGLRDMMAIQCLSIWTRWTL